MEAIANRLALTITEIESNRSSLASSPSTLRANSSGKTFTTSAMSKLMSRKSITLAGNGPGKQITVLEAPKYQAKLSKAGTISSLTALPGNVLQKAVSGSSDDSATKTISAFFKAQQSTLGLIDPESELPC